MKQLLNHPKEVHSFQAEIDQRIREMVTRLGAPSRLKDACEYALMSGGKRFRPALVLMIAKAIGSQNVFPAALAIEAFHTASLIADDLPCMDNDSLRRNQPTLHVELDETTALLASYALISAGYELLAENATLMDDPQRGIVAVQITSKNTGLKGATGGQYDDIFPEKLTEETLREIIHKKTVTLFEIAFSYGWIFGGGDMAKLPLVKKASEHFGLAFQIADDMGDIDQDLTNGRKVNMCTVLGLQKAQEMFHVELQSYNSCCLELGLEGISILRPRL